MRFEAAEGREDWERRMREEVIMGMGIQSHMGITAPKERRQSLQWSIAMKGRRTGVVELDREEGWRGRFEISGMEIR